MSDTPFIRSVFFADIAGSSKIYELLGDDPARRLIMELLGSLSDVARKYSGEFLRTFGDELMCAFASADDAVVAAARMHQVFEDHSSLRMSEIDTIALYIRIDTGPVIRSGNTIFGDAVNTAAKMKVLAKPFQTLISKTTLDYLSPHLKSMTRFVDKLPIKGKSGIYDIFEYLHEAESATLVMEGPIEELTPLASLDLIFDSTTYSVDANRSTITIGRLPANDIVLLFPGVSRMHAKIEHRKGKFVLVDESSNGTYVHASGCEPVYVKRDEFQLVGKGTICPVKKDIAQSPGAIHFAIQPYWPEFI